MKTLGVTPQYMPPICSSRIEFAGIGPCHDGVRREMWFGADAGKVFQFIKGSAVCEYTIEQAEQIVRDLQAMIEVAKAPT